MSGSELAVIHQVKKSVENLSIATNPVGETIYLPYSAAGPKLTTSAGTFLQTGYVENDPAEFDAEYWKDVYTFLTIDTEETDNLNSIATNGNGVWIAVGNSGYITRSSDDGKTWTSINSSTTDDLSDIDTDNNGVWVISCVNDSNVLRSDDNGLTWELVEISTSIEWESLSTDKNGIWIIASRNSSTKNKSTDNGLTWFNISAPGPVLELSTDRNGVWIYADDSFECFRSTDNGSTWAAIDLPGGNVNNRVTGISYGNGVWVIVSLDGFIVRSEDGGLTWEEASLNVNTANFMSVATDGNGRWVADATRTPYISNDDGLTWTRGENLSTSTNAMTAFGDTWGAPAGNGQVIFRRPETAGLANEKSQNNLIGYVRIK